METNEATQEFLQRIKDLVEDVERLGKDLPGRKSSVLDWGRSMCELELWPLETKIREIARDIMLCCYANPGETTE